MVTKTSKYNAKKKINENFPKWTIAVVFLKQFVRQLTVKRTMSSRNCSLCKLFKQTLLSMLLNTYL